MGLIVKLEKLNLYILKNLKPMMLSYFVLAWV